MLIRIFTAEDRQTVAGILVKNGYTVSMLKIRKGPRSKAYDYCLEAIEKEDSKNGNTEFSDGHD